MNDTSNHPTSPASSPSDLVAEVERLKAELARLTPSGQVAEDEETVRESLKDLYGYGHRNEAANGTVVQDRGLRALSRLAAQAQGYEAMKARDEAWKAATTCDSPEQVAARAHGLREAVAAANEARIRAEAERDAALAAHAAAEKRWEACEAERISAVEQRDAAMADNAALLQALVTKCEQCNGTGTFLPHCEFCSDSGHGHECPPPKACTHPGVTPVLSLPHPDATLLAEHAKALVRARNEGREEALDALSWVTDLGLWAMSDTEMRRLRAPKESES